MAMDRSKYRNPDMPVGYVKKESELVYKYGVEIDGEHYIWAPYIYDAHIEEYEDYATLSDLILSDDECVVEATVLGENGTMSISTIKKEKEDENETAGSNVTKQGKKGPDNSDTSQMIIDVKKGEKKKKKSKREHKSGYRSDSSSSSSTLKHRRHHSPSSHRHRSLSSHRNRSPSSHRDRSSSSHRHRSPSSHRHHTTSSRRRHSPSSDKHDKIVTYSPSPSPPPCDEYLDVKVKEEFIFMDIKEEHLDEPQHLFGSYHCDVCNITMNSLLTFNTHVNGKKHRKSLNAKNVPEAVAQSIPATVISDDQSKYPVPPPGVIRKKVRTPAKIQHVLEQCIKIPCPGLNYVIEIQGIGSVQYYCTICDSVCSSNSITAHLTGYKHQFKSVKIFKPSVYERLQDEPKFKAEKEIRPILRAVQKKEGMGRMAVEIEELVDSSATSHSVSQPSTSRGYRSIPSTSKGISKEPGVSFNELLSKATIPNMDASDFFCERCQSHMNSVQMWEAHIRGKRHLTNLKKNPGDLPSKTKTVLVDKRAYLLDRIKNECPCDEPIVGLKEIRETEILETRSHSYQCFLCGSCHTSLDILEHLMSLKHRTKYLDHIGFAGREIISGMSDITAESLVKDMCAQVEAVEGSGKPAVHVNKSALLYR